MKSNISGGAPNTPNSAGTPGTTNDRWGSVLSINFVMRFIQQQHSSFDNDSR